MRSLNITEFRKQCLTLIDDLPQGGIVIIKRGKPVAKVTPIKSGVDNSWMLGALKGKLEITGDTFSTGVQWNAES